MKRFVLCSVLLWQLAFAQNATYTVQPGDTLTRLARTFGVSVADLVSANGLDDPDRLVVGRQLVVPSLQTWDEPLPLPFTEVALTPQTATQGRVQALRVGLAPGATLYSVSYLGRSVPVYGDTVLLPTPVLQEPGTHSLGVTASVGGEPVTLTLPVTVADGRYDREQITLSAETSRLLAPEIVSREHALLETTCSGGDERRWGGAFEFPVAEPSYSSVFGTLRSYNGGPYSGFHRGLDFRGATGTPVYAVAAGRVVLSETLQLYGNTVVVRHGLGVCSAYMHLDERGVTAGDEVAAGDTLGTLGATGLVTGPHLHFEVRVEGVPVAPLQWLEEGVAR